MNENKNIEKHISFVFEGNISVKAAIETNYREVFQIVVDKSKKDKDTAYILRLAKQRNIEIIYKSKEEIDLIAKGKTHGGLIAYVGERTYQLLHTNYHCVALVEGIEDPFNFAHIIRSLYALGVKAMIIPARNWNTAADVLVKTSAGASEKMEMWVYEDVVEALNILKAQGYRVVAANRKDAVAIDEYAFSLNTVLCIGGEMRGISKKVLAACDDFVFIPYGNDFKNALTAVSATSILAYEYLKQHK